MTLQTAAKTQTLPDSCAASSFWRFAMDKVQCHVADSQLYVQGNDQRCYDWTQSKTQLFRNLIGICGCVTLFHPRCRFLRLHFRYLYIFLIDSSDGFLVVLGKPVRTKLNWN
ncbi:hypothetical protein VNO77_24717 [Canavalia gladiata]|uniref:Uncharacterized protein n=1 Tax=Canavalia gladiata TaxID=3824 RepID=A0AAN9L6T3_CANGL